MSSRHNKYVSVTDWFATPTSKGSSTAGTTGTGTTSSGAGFSGGSWGSGGSGGGQYIQIIKTNDTTPESNSNVYSALRVHNSFIAKDKNERTSGKLSSDIAFEVGEYVSGTSGAIMYIDPDTLQTTAELDRLYVRIKAYFETLEIINVNSVGGKQIISPAGSIKCSKVEVKGTIDVEKEVQSTDEDGNLLYDEDGNPIMETIVESVDNGIPEDTYRCYFLAEQDGEKVENRFKVGDQAYSQTFNAKSGTTNQASNTYYWRLVTGVGEDYIDLSMSDCDTDSDAPKAEDIICHRGSRTDNDRRNLLEFSAVDAFSPSITLYQGVGILDEEKGLYPYSLTNKDVISYGVNQTTNKAFMNVYGNMYVGDREGNSFIRFDEEGGLTIKGNLSAGTTLGDSDLTLEERIEQASQAYKEDINAFKDAVIKSFNEVQNQIDGAIETYFLDPVPTLENEPASNWDTDEVKAQHIGDLYYSAAGNAYRFQYTTITNEDGSITNSYYWNPVQDTEVITALANAKKAQDTADSKRKIFVSQPKTNESYEIGDMWANATYIDPITNQVIYEGDLLRAVAVKDAGEAFDINDWELASKYTDDSAAIAAMEAAKNAQATADKAQTDADTAASRLDSWAADGVISPTEKQGIKEEYVRVLNDRDHINDEYEKYFLGEPTLYNEKHLVYINLLIDIFTAETETVIIPDNFETAQNEYYAERTTALNTISTASKKVADDAQAAADNAKKEAEAALTAAENAKEIIYDMNLAVTGSAEYVREAFADGIINKGERATIENSINQINTIQAQVDESYKEVVSNTLLTGSNELENLKNSYTTFTNAVTELKASITDISNLDSVENIDKAVFENRYTNFNAAYSTYTQWLHAATKYVEEKLNSSIDTTINALGGYQYLKDAINNEHTTVTGGLVLTTMLALGYTDDSNNYIVNAGINGDAPKNNDIVIWAGGSNVDIFVEPDNPNAADFLVRADGTGYAAGGNFWWESDGTIHADPLSFLISDESVGALLSSFQVMYNVENGKPVPYTIDPKIPFTTLTIATDLIMGSEAKLHFGDAYLRYDQVNNAVCVENANGDPINFYVTGGVSMYGLGNTSVTSIMDAIINNLDPNTLEVKDGLLTVVGGTGGGTADAVAWGNITDKPSWIGSTKPSYNMGELSNVGTWANSVADVDRIMYQAAGSSMWVAKSLSSIGGGGGVSGDYLPLSGGTLRGAVTFANNTWNPVGDDIAIGDIDVAGFLGLKSLNTARTGIWFYGSSGEDHGALYTDSTILLWRDCPILHSGNYSNYALPANHQNVNPNTENGNWLGMTNINTPVADIFYHILSSNHFKGTSNSNGYWGAQLALPTQQSASDNMYYRKASDSSTNWQKWIKILDENNFSSYALPLSGGTVNTSEVYGIKINSTNTNSGIEFDVNNVPTGVVITGDKYGIAILNLSGTYNALGIKDDGTPYFLNHYSNSYSTIWHSGNDGSGSGLDADLLDGKQPSALNVGSANSVLINYTGQNKDYEVVLTNPKAYNSYGIDSLYHANENGKYLTFNPSTGSLNVGGTIRATGSINSYYSYSDGSSTISLNPRDTYSEIICSKYNVTYDCNLVLARQGGNVGIGTTSPSSKLHIHYSKYDILKITRSNTSGAGIYFSNSNGELGDIGFHSDTNFVIRNIAHDAKNLVLSQSGNLLTRGGMSMYSDQRKKTILNHVELSLKQIANAPLVEHFYNSDDKRTTHVGSIAQYWASMNDWFCKLDSEGFYTMEIQNCALASAISIARELDRYESKTDKTIKQLKKRICQLEEELERLKSA